MDYYKLFHLQNLQIKGLYVPYSKSFHDGNDLYYRFFRLRVCDRQYIYEPVPIKLPIVPEHSTDYIYINDTLYYKNNPLHFENTTYKQDLLPQEESKWHLKNYTFPFEGTKNKYIELRINPRLSGYCPGKCAFCHRWHSNRIKPDNNNITPSEIIKNIIRDEGVDVFKNINRIILISELYGNESKLLDTLESTYFLLLNAGYSENSEFNCCTSEIRSKKGINRLYTIIKPKRFSYSLEFFSNRSLLMESYKGIPINEVYSLLLTARDAGFNEIQLNYLAGIEGDEEYKKGFYTLLKSNIIDTIGLSTFTTFTKKQIQYRFKNAYHPEYYLKLALFLNSLGISAFHPESYDMRSPYSILL